MAKILLVDADADGANDGSSWANAYNSLSDAINAAQTGDEIRVAQGKYKPDRGVGVDSGNRNATFKLLSGVAIRGGYAGYGEPDPDARDFSTYFTALSGDLLENDTSLVSLQYQNVHDFVADPSLDDNSFVVVTAENVRSDAVLDGFFIISGHGDESSTSTGAGLTISSGQPTIINCTFARNSVLATAGGARGGAVSIADSAPNFVNCLFLQNIAFGANTSAFAGAMYSVDSSPTLDSCRFQSNIATGYDSDYYGGAVYISGGEMTAGDCRFTSNRNDYVGGAVAAAAGGRLLLDGCKFESNIATHAGGAIFCDGAESDISACTFTANSANDLGGAVFQQFTATAITGATFSENSAGSGGALYHTGMDPPASIGNCNFTNNVATFYGGAAYFAFAESQLLNCLFDKNSAATGGALAASDCGALSIDNSAFINNLAVISAAGGGAVADIRTGIVAHKVTFSRNQAGEGGAAYALSANPQFVECSFTENIANDGGAVADDNSPSQFNTCTFTQNSAQQNGGSLYASASGACMLDCAFAANTAYKGGAIYAERASGFTAGRCYFLGNTANDSGGAIAIEQSQAQPSVVNSLLAANSAGNMGGASYSSGGDLTVTGCTIAYNTAKITGGLYNDNNTLSLTNSIVWANNDITGVTFVAQIKAGSMAVPDHCCIDHYTGQFGGAGNINYDPTFANPLGRDFHLRLGSPCIDAGRSTVVAADETDLDRNARIVRAAVDMGAYEFPGPFVWYVDAVTGDDNNSGFRRQNPLATISKALDVAAAGDSIFVLPAVYTEEVRFNGRAVVLQGLPVDGLIPVIQNPGDFAVSFYQGEGPDSVLRNFVIANSLTGIFIAGSNPRITNITFVGNDYGVACYAAGNPIITSCIFYNNSLADFDACSVSFCRTSQPAIGPGNITDDPMFADPNSGDYHLLSKRGRYRPSTAEWILDSRTSPCIDAGDPSIKPETEKSPNGGRLNMGAFGGTDFASMSEWAIQGDADFDGRVNMRDIAIVLDNWLEDVRYQNTSQQ